VRLITIGIVWGVVFSPCGFAIEYLPTVRVKVRGFGGYNYFLMQDYNSWREDENRRMIQEKWDPLPDFHFGINFGTELMWTFMDWWGLGVGWEWIQGREVNYYDDYSLRTTQVEEKGIFGFRHQAKGVHLFTGLSLMPMKWEIKWRIGVSVGLYYMWTYFYKDKTEDKKYSNGDLYHKYEYVDSRMKSLAVGGNFILHGEKSLNEMFSIFIEIKGRRAKLGDFEGRRERLIKVEKYIAATDTMEKREEQRADDVKLVYAKRAGEIYFGPLFYGEWDEYDIVREGIIDFSGVGLNIGLIYEF
jgi:hypothetical protein